MKRPKWIWKTGFVFGLLSVISCSGPHNTEDFGAVSLTLQPLAEQMCRQQRGNSALLPPAKFTTDGCSLWPDGSWQSCCFEHDMAYWCGGSAQLRKAADHTLKQCVIDSGSPLTGVIMGTGVRVGGLWLLPLPWRWGYGWPWLSPMK